jgi:biopolymer transport protein ExbD
VSVDRRVPHGAVRAILDILEREGIVKIALAVDPVKPEP